jgi:hypothetical protein
MLSVLHTPCLQTLAAGTGSQWVSHTVPPPFLPADVGDVDNARALFERVLTEDANRKSVLLWERYLAFEFEMGDLQSALRLEKRARCALLCVLHLSLTGRCC